MESSSQLSSKKTKKYRDNVLSPAGVEFFDEKDKPDLNIQSIWNDLRTRSNLLDRTLESSFSAYDLEERPWNLFSKSPVVDDSVGRELVSTSQRVVTAVMVGVSQVYNESMWKSDCHALALSTLKNYTRGSITLRTEENLPALTLSPVHYDGDVLLSSNKPDYIVGCTVSRDTAFNIEHLDSFLSRGLNPYLDSKQIAFPLLVAESKSELGLLFEAENQCAVSIVKMLSKLSNLGGKAATLPVFGLVLFGTFYRILIANLSTFNGRPIYRIQRMRSGDLTNTWDSLHFQMILWKLTQWMQKISMTILEELELFKKRTSPLPQSDMLTRDNLRS